MDPNPTGFHQTVGKPMDSIGVRELRLASEKKMRRRRRWRSLSAWFLWSMLALCLVAAVLRLVQTQDPERCAIYVCLALVVWTEVHWLHHRREKEDRLVRDGAVMAGSMFPGMFGGQLAASSTPNQCQECLGTGKLGHPAVPCPRCNGTGVEPRNDPGTETGKVY